MQLHRGEILFSQGESGDLYQLTSGLLKVTRIGADGSVTLLNILVPDEVFPHHSLITPKVYHATVSALTTSEVKPLPADQWYHSLHYHPEKYKKVALILQENVRKMQQRLVLTTLPSKQRIPFFRTWIQEHCPDVPLEKLLTQEEIGQFLGLSRETVNRLLRQEGK